MHLSLYQIKVYSHNSTYNNFYIYYNHTLQTIYRVIWQIAHLIFFICTTLQKRAELQIFSFHFLRHMFYLSWCYHNCPSLHINIFTISNFTTVIIKNTPEQKSWSVIYCSETSWDVLDCEIDYLFVNVLRDGKALKYRVCGFGCCICVAYWGRLRTAQQAPLKSQQPLRLFYIT